jgi:hypothetical protein
VSLRRLLGLVAVLAMALVPSACGSGSGDAGSAGDLLKRASRETAKSADVKVELEAELKGVDEVNGPLKLKLEGPYRSNGAAALPDLDWRMHAEGAGKSFDARLITVRDNAYIEYQGATYEVGTQLISSLTAQLQRNRTDPKELRSLGLDASGWIEDADVSDAEVGGVATKRISGDVDVRKMLEGIGRLLAKDPSAARLPESTIDEIADAVKEAHVETDVGRDDGIMRRSSAELRFEVPEARRAGAKGLEGGELKVLFEQTDVNGDQRVTPPSGARPIQELLRGFGIPPELLLGPGATMQSPG